MESPERRASYEFNVTELLVLICIIGLLAGLIVPLIMRARVSEYNSWCRNNLRQLTLACQNANDLNGYLPPYDSRGMPHNNVYSNEGADYGSHFFHLLPFLEHVSLYNWGRYPGNSGRGYAVSVLGGSEIPPTNYDSGPPQSFVDYAPTSPPAKAVLAQVVKKFICPSDPSARPLDGMCTNGWAGSSYGANFLVFANPDPADIDDPDGLGLHGTEGAWGAQLNIPEGFPKGTAHTILFAEKYVSCGDSTVWGANRAGSAWAWPNHDVRFAPAVAMEYPWKDATTLQVQPVPTACDYRRAQTGHSYGMEIGMVDGSGRSVSPRVLATIYQRAMQPHGNEPPGDNW
jgi:hypothetical protein